MWLKAREGKTGAVAARGVLVEGCDHPLDPVLGFDPPLFGCKGVPAFCGSPPTGVTDINK